MPMKFATEKKFFDTNKAEWAKAHDREFALIKGDSLVGFYHSFQEAVEEGLKKFGSDQDFFIEEILSVNPTNFVYLAHYADPHQTY